jgi:hypothetical protein
MGTYYYRTVQMYLRRTLQHIRPTSTKPPRGPSLSRRLPTVLNQLHLGTSALISALSYLCVEPGRSIVERFIVKSSSLWNIQISRALLRDCDTDRLIDQWPKLFT